MNKINSKQRDIKFIYCGDPITIDKRNSWGTDPSNMQIANRGAFLKMKNETTVSHLVQPNEQQDAPVGWIKTDVPSLFDKAPIWVSSDIVPANTPYEIQTLDGLLKPCFDEPSVLCYNCNPDGSINMDDVWLQKISDLKKNYDY